MTGLYARLITLKIKTMNELNKNGIIANVVLSSLIYHRENEGDAKTFRCTKTGFWYYENELLEMFTRKEIDNVRAIR